MKALWDRIRNFEHYYNNLLREKQRCEASLLRQRASHQALRNPLLKLGSATAAIGAGIIAYNYCNSYPKLAALATGACSFVGTYLWGSKYGAIAILPFELRIF